MRIGGLQKTTLLDFPGLIAAIVFTDGCNLRCPWCHNASLVTGSSESQHISTEDFFQFLERRSKILDGVVVTGGEPTIHADLEEFIVRIRSYGMAVKLDTNGTRPDVLARLLDKNLLDYVAIDVKAAPEQYCRAAGVSVDLLSLSAAIEEARRAPRYEFRLTLVPGIHHLEDMKSYSRFLRRGPLYLQVFRPVATLVDSSLCDTAPFAQQEIEAFLHTLSSHMEGPVLLRS